MQHPVECYFVLEPTVVEGKEAAIALIQEVQRNFNKRYRVPLADLKRAELPLQFRPYVYFRDAALAAQVTFAPPLLPWNVDHWWPVPPTYVLPEPPLFPDLVGADNWFWDRLRFGSPDADAFTEAV